MFLLKSAITLATTKSRLSPLGHLLTQESFSFQTLKRVQKWK